MTHYIYIPGLSERFDPLRRLALRRWADDDARVTLVPMRWSNKTETYEQKYDRVVEAIKQLNEERIVLVGESAGGGMALLTFSRNMDRVAAVVTVCGYNHGADVNPRYRRSNPAFYALAQQLETIVESITTDVRDRIVTVYSPFDAIVTPEHSLIDGAREAMVNTRGHLWSIAGVLVTGPKNGSGVYW